MLRILVISSLLSAALADTPANCTYEDIRGTWSFHIGPTGFDKTIDCSSFQVEKEVAIELKYPDVALDQFGQQGFWTLIYNQGFEVVIDNKKYFAFSNYTTVNNTVVNHCDSTFHGWSHDIHGYNWACYYGRKVSNEAPSVAFKSTKHLDIHDSYFDQKYIPNLDYIDEINRETDLWEATHYQELEDMTLRDRLMRAGGVPVHGRYPFPIKAPVTEESLNAVKDLPENFDWRDVSGINYVSPIRNQRSCGSCYAFGSMAMMEARIRLISNNSIQPIFSTQEIVSCSEYSQGCAGGFPYLIAGKYAEDFGVIEEECYPYEAMDESCKPYKPNCLRYHATDYHYIGGYYGGCNEQLMLAELVQNGPIAISFEVTADFQTYTRGIYHHTGLKDKFNPWEITNHVVAIVGYGVEKGVKYWTVKNSWGDWWGEEGYFRIMRGTDELSIESMAVSATPVVP